MFGFGDKMTLTSYVPKRRVVLLIPSMHHSAAVNDQTKKPEIIEFYNSTKGGIEALDEKCSTYNCKGHSRRWPLTIFFTISNISLVNAFVVYSALCENPEKTTFNFTKALAWQLVIPELENRITNKHLPRRLQQTISSLLQKDVPEEPKAELTSRVRCAKCPHTEDRKTKTTYISCKLPVCGKCAKLICEDCV